MRQTVLSVLLRPSSLLLLLLLLLLGFPDLFVAAVGIVFVLIVEFEAPVSKGRIILMIVSVVVVVSVVVTMMTIGSRVLSVD